MSRTDPQVILAALQTLTQAGLTFQSIKTLLDMPERTVEDVNYQLDQTDRAIEAARNDD